MQIRKAYCYHLYPTRAQAARLEWVLRRCQELYNAALQERREAYRMAGVTVGYYAQKRELPGVKEERPEYRQGGSQVLQDVIQRVDRALAAFFRRVRAGEKPGYPRFRSRDRYDSFTYSQAGWKLTDGRMVLSGIGALKVRWSRAIQGPIKTVTIRRSADQWYVCFACVLDVVHPVPPDRPATALDVGLEYFATLADGSHIDNPRYLCEAEEGLARRQRRVQTKKRGGRNRRRALKLACGIYRLGRSRVIDGCPSG
jgi:putative transposase